MAEPGQRLSEALGSKELFIVDSKGKGERSEHDFYYIYIYIYIQRKSRGYNTSAYLWVFGQLGSAQDDFLWSGAEKMAAIASRA